MAVYQYTGVVKNREDFAETGTVLARSEDEARNKLEPFNFREVKLIRLDGIKSFVKQFTADVR